MGIGKTISYLVTFSLRQFISFLLFNVRYQAIVVRNGGII